jgi:hypothetical protein
MSMVDTGAAAPGSRRIAWVHPPGGFVGLSLLNALLRILTLGVYHFWGKTEVRQRIWSAVRIDGEPLEYRGTGGELFKGFVVVFLIVLVPLSLISLLPLLLGASPGRDALFQLGLFLVIFALWGFAIYRARRYRLSRTLARHPRCHVGALHPVRLDLPLDHGSFRSLVDRGVPPGCSVPSSTTRNSATSTSRSQAGPARSMRATGWSG